MDHQEAERKIAALKAIIQTLVPERFWTTTEGGAKANFRALVEDDEPVATAIANELTEHEIEEGFEWVNRASASAEAEMQATPIVPYLTPEQAERMRMKVEAIDQPDQSAYDRGRDRCRDNDPDERDAG